jgi:hypothetical protein
MHKSNLQGFHFKLSKYIVSYRTGTVAATVTLEMSQTYPELLSFTINTKITVLSVLQMESLHDLFQLPLSV